MPTGLGDEQLWLCPTLDNVTPFNDLSTQGNNGTAVGGLATVADTGSGGAYCYDFDGSNDYIDIASSGISTPTSAYSVSVWVNPSVTTLFHVFIAGQTDGFRFANLGNNNANGNILCGQSNDWLQAGSYDLNQWQCVCYTYDGTTVSLYKNGALIGSRTDAPVSYVEQLVRMGADASGGNLLGGKTDDLRTYSRVLTQSEITHLATARGIEGRPFDGLGDEQLWLCPSLENSPNDLSGNNNNGVYQNGMGTVTDTAEGGSLAYDFDGVGDYIDCGPIGVSSGLSISAWIKRDEVANFVGIVTRYDEAAGTDSCYYLMSSAFTRHGIRLYASQGGGVLKSEDYADSVGDASWSHVAMRVGLGTDRGEIFVDGLKVVSVQVDNDNMSSFLDTAGMDTLVGARRNSTGASKYFNGLMDDIRIYNRVLTQAEISWLATERGMLGTPPEGLGDEQLWLCPSIQDSANDISGNGNDGTYNGGMGTIADTAEGGSLAYSFDQVDDYINCGTTGSPADMSLSLWINELSFSNSNRGIANTMTNGGTSDEYGLFTGGAGSLRFLAYGNRADDTSALLSNTWYHITGVRDTASGFVKFYRDGLFISQVAITTTAPSSFTKDFVIGRYQGQFEFGGLLDDIRFYDRALTQAEISWLATERGVLGTPPAGLGDEQLWLCPSIQDSPNDISGNNNNGVYFGGMGTVTDVAEGGSLAYDFDGVDDYLKVDNSIEFGAVSVSCWVYSDLTYPTFRAIDLYDLSRSTGNPDVVIQHLNYSSYRAFSQISGVQITASHSVTPAQWHHLCTVFDGTSLNLYVDGSLAVSVASTVTPQSDQAFFGSRTGTSEFMDGKMDDIRSYNRALTQAEITHLASQRGVLGPAGGGPPPSVFFNPFKSNTFFTLDSKRIR